MSNSLGQPDSDDVFLQPLIFILPILGQVGYTSVESTILDQVSQEINLLTGDQAIVFVALNSKNTTFYATAQYLLLSHIGTPNDMPILLIDDPLSLEQLHHYLAGNGLLGSSVILVIDPFSLAKLLHDSGTYEAALEYFNPDGTELPIGRAMTCWLMITRSLLTLQPADLRS